MKYFNLILFLVLSIVLSSVGFAQYTIIADTNGEINYDDDLVGALAPLHTPVWTGNLVINILSQNANHLARFVEFPADFAIRDGVQIIVDEGVKIVFEDMFPNVNDQTFNPNIVHFKGFSPERPWGGVKITGTFPGGVADPVWKFFNISDVSGDNNSSIEISMSSLIQRNIQIRDFVIDGYENEPACGIKLNSQSIVIDIDDGELTDCNDCIFISNTFTQVGTPNHIWTRLTLTNSKSGIYLENAANGINLPLRNLTLETLIVEDMISYGIFVGDGYLFGNWTLTENSTISNCDLNGIVVCGDQEDAIGKLFTLTLHSTSIQQSGEEGILLRGNQQQLFLKEDVNIVNNGEDGILVHGASAEVMTIPTLDTWNGIVRGNGGNGMSVVGCGATFTESDTRAEREQMYVWINGGEFEDNEEGLYIASEGCFVYLTGGSYSSNNNSGIHLTNGEFGVSDPDLSHDMEVYINGTRASNNGQNGILGDVKDDFIKNPDFDKLLLYAAGDANFSNNGGCGALFHGQRLTNGQYYFGVQFEYHSIFKDERIHAESSSHFNSNAEDGLFMRGAHNTMRTQVCEFIGNTGNGIHIQRQVYPNTPAIPLGVSWSDYPLGTGVTFISGNQMHGVFYDREASGQVPDKNSTTAWKTYIGGNLMNGIYATDHQTSSMHHFNESRIIGNHINGIRTNNTSNNYIKADSCLIASNRENGVYGVQGDLSQSLELVCCTIENNSDYGIYLPGTNMMTKLIIRRNLVQENGYSGLYLKKHGPLITGSNVITQNDFYNNNNSGSAEFERGASVLLGGGRIPFHNNMIHNGLIGLAVVGNSYDIDLKNLIIVMDDPTQHYLAAIYTRGLSPTNEVLIQNSTIIMEGAGQSTGFADPGAIVMTGNAKPTLDLLVIDLDDNAIGLRDISGGPLQFTHSVIRNVTTVYANGTPSDVTGTVVGHPYIYGRMPEVVAPFIGMGTQDGYQFAYHLSWLSPGINMVDPGGANADPPFTKYPASTEDPTDAGAFGGEFAFDWGTFTGSANYGQSRRLYFYSPFPIAPYSTTSRTYSLTGGELTNSKYYVLCDLEWFPNEPYTPGTPLDIEDIPAGCELYFLPYYSHSPTEQKTGMTINRCVDILGEEGDGVFMTYHNVYSGINIRDS